MLKAVQYSPCCESRGLRKEAPCCESGGMRKGPWTRDEDSRLKEYITKHGHRCWRAIPRAAGLQRCGKSCRLRWINYLRPDVKRGHFSDAEEQLIITLQSLLGNRWSLVAGRLPERTENEIKNHWNTNLKKKLRSLGIDPSKHQTVIPMHSAAGRKKLANAAGAMTAAGHSANGSASSKNVLKFKPQRTQTASDNDGERGDVELQESTSVTTAAAKPTAGHSPDGATSRETVLIVKAHRPKPIRHVNGKILAFLETLLDYEFSSGRKDKIEHHLSRIVPSICNDSSGQDSPLENVMAGSFSCYSTESTHDRRDPTSKPEWLCASPIFTDHADLHRNVSMETQSMDEEEMHRPRVDSFVVSQE